MDAGGRTAWVNGGAVAAHASALRCWCADV